MTRSTFRGLCVCLATVSLAGCQDYDGGFSESKIRESQYMKNFVNAFDEVDPNGTWNATRFGSIEVTVDETSQVMVYAKGLSVNLQLSCDVVEAGETKTISYNAPKGVNEVYVISKNMNSWQSQTIMVGENAKMKFTSAGTRALPETYTYGVAHPISYVGNAYSVDNRPGTIASPGGVKEYYNYQGGYNTNLTAGTMDEKSFPYPTWGNLYAAYPWPYTSEITDPVTVGISTSVIPTQFAIEHDDVTLTDAIQNAIRNVVGTADDHIEVLQPYTQDLNYMTTAEPGTVELTLVSTQTNSNNAIGYYYTTGAQTADQLKAVKKYMLIPNMGAQATGDKFKLVYFGENYDEAGTYNFPKDVQIHFFLSRSGGNGISTFNLQERKVQSGYWDNGWPDQGFTYTTYTDFYGMDVQYMYFSDSELNTVAQETFSSFTFPATAAFNVMGQNCISFEDYPSAGSIDWNDAVFTIDAPFNDFKSFDEVVSFVIAVEDLGDSFDLDYNDCVISVQQQTTTLKYSNGTSNTHTNPAKITLLASGGTLPIAIQYDDNTLVTETHQKFGVATTVPVNVNAPTGVSKAPVSFEWSNAPQVLNLAVDAPKFKFIVTQPSGVNTTVNVPAAQNGTSTVPVAFIIPDVQTWEWPDECVDIRTKYTGFATWVANNSAADAEYWYNYQWGKTYSSGSGNGSGSSDGSSSGGNGQGSVDPALTTTITEGIANDMVLSADYFPSTCTKATITFTHNDSTERFYTAFQANNTHTSEIETSVANGTVSHELSSTELDAAKNGNLKLTDYTNGTYIKNAVRIVIVTE